MDYFCLIQSAVSYIESRVRETIDHESMCLALGVSVPHFRDVFRKRTDIPLARYILERRFSNAAFELAYTDRKILDVSLDYGFESYDTFTRAFTRIVGMTPSDFRRAGICVGRVKISAGAFGPGMKKAGGSPSFPVSPEETMTDAVTEKTDDSCVLFGVQKVQYTYEESTPFPAVLRSCLNYMGQDIRYARLMAATGAAFRLRWNLTQWDGGNVDIMNIYEKREEAYIRGFQAAGREWRFLWQTGNTRKEDFEEFIKIEIDAGRPVIALGIIGPPEAAIVCGYRNGGKTLLGWNFFQENPEYAGDAKTDDSGYFICDTWWENPETRLLMSIGEERATGLGARELLENAYAVLTNERMGDYAGGQQAYTAWALAMANDGEFSTKMPLPKLFERLMCQNDAMTMVGEGRAYAACFMRETEEELSKAGKIELAELAAKAARCFDAEFKLVQEMLHLPGIDNTGEEHVRFFAKNETRKAIVSRIYSARDFDKEAAETIGEMLKRWDD